MNQKFHTACFEHSSGDTYVCGWLTSDGETGIEDCQCNGLSAAENDCLRQMLNGKAAEGNVSDRIHWLQQRIEKE